MHNNILHKSKFTIIVFVKDTDPVNGTSIFKGSVFFATCETDSSEQENLS